VPQRRSPACGDCLHRPRARCERPRLRKRLREGRKAQSATKLPSDSPLVRKARPPSAGRLTPRSPKCVQHLSRGAADIAKNSCATQRLEPNSSSVASLNSVLKNAGDFLHEIILVGYSDILQVFPRMRDAQLACEIRNG